MDLDTPCQRTISAQLGCSSNLSRQARQKLCVDWVFFFQSRHPYLDSRATQDLSNFLKQSLLKQPQMRLNFHFKEKPTCLSWQVWHQNIKQRTLNVIFANHAYIWWFLYVPQIIYITLFLIHNSYFTMQ